MSYNKNCKKGKITQMVECMLCKHKVIGSNPIFSSRVMKTNFKTSINQFFMGGLKNKELL